MKVIIAVKVRQENTLPADKHLVLLVSLIPHCNLLRALALVSLLRQACVGEIQR